MFAFQRNLSCPLCLANMRAGGCVATLGGQQLYGLQRRNGFLGPLGDGPWGWKVHSPPTLQLRSSSQDRDSPSLKNAIEEVEKMRASAIKKELMMLGVSFADCFEKQELVVRLATARLGKVRRGGSDENGVRPLARLPMTRLKSTQASPKDYILVPLKINGQGPFNFVLDTASTISLIVPSIVYGQLGLSPTPAKRTVGLFGGGATTQSFLSVALGRVELGDHVLSSVDALLMDASMLQGWDPAAAGIMGLNMLSQFDVEFDNPRNQIIFHSAGAVSRGECDLQGLEKLSSSVVVLGILSVEVRLGTAPPEMALLDLGSSLCVASPDIARLAGVPEHILTSTRPTLGGGGIGQVGTMPFSGALIDVDIITAKKGTGAAHGADFTIKAAQFAVGEVPAIRAVGCRILLGVNVFKHVRMIFSQSSRSVHMERPRT